MPPSPTPRPLDSLTNNPSDLDAVYIRLDVFAFATAALRAAGPRLASKLNGLGWPRSCTCPAGPKAVRPSLDSRASRARSARCAVGTKLTPAPTAASPTRASDDRPSPRASLECRNLSHASGVNRLRLQGEIRGGRLEHCSIHSPTVLNSAPQRAGQVTTRHHHPWALRRIRCRRVYRSHVHDVGIACFAAHLDHLHHDPIYGVRLEEPIPVPRRRLEQVRI